MQENIKEIVIDRIRKAAMPNSKINTFNVAKVLARMTRNRSLLYSNTIEEKDLILHHLKQKYLKTKSKNDIVVEGGKNLLYFTIFLDDDYLEVLNMCLRSIVANTPNINFDVLFITDTAMREKIEKLEVVSKFRVDYMLSDTPKTAPLASLKKLNIFDYEKMSEYSKILFFDVDILCIKDLNIIFNKPILPEKLYVSGIELYKSPLLLSPTHGIMHLSIEDAEFINDNPRAVPFNAGQFLFLNSSRMKEHFDNTRWLKDVWPDAYFYEQSFMNHYFVLKSLTGAMIAHSPDTISDSEEGTYSNKQLVSVTFNLIKNNDRPRENSDILRLSELRSGRPVMKVTGATNSAFSVEYMLKSTIMPEGVLKDAKLMHNEHTVAIHFAATLPSGIDKKTFMNFYANAHKLHI